MEWLRSQERSSMRWLQWFILLAVGLLVSIFLSTVVTSSQALAADAKWDSSKISYDNETFERVSDVDKIKALDLGTDQMVYMPKKTVANNQDIRVIHFATTGDLGSMTSVSLTTFTYTPPNTYTKKESTTLSIDPPSQNSASSCEVAGGIGWILCPVSAWLASSIDWMFGVLKSFLVVPPLQTGNQTSGIFLAWNIVRNIANSIFIIMFIVIIYSQITSMGISNYGIKKMLPRLIIAAILVNLSFHVCAILLDLSNIAGSALQDMFMNIRNTVATLGGSAPASEPMTWQEVTFQILGGAAGGAALAAGIVMRAELLPFIVPLLSGIGLVILLVVIIMAARQALIVILIIISPLAFVAYLLPGTEKWFDKWKDVFLTMLIFFPGFAAAFGGAQLAGSVIMQNAAGPNGAVMYILGMAVQIAPLALTPLMIKLGGGLLGKFTGLVNDRSKGLFDRSKNWAKERSEITKHKKFNKHPDSKFTPTAWRRRLAQSSQNRKDRLKDLQDESDVIRKGTGSYAKIDQYRRMVNEDKKASEGRLEAAWGNHLMSNSAAFDRYAQAQSWSEQAEASKGAADTYYKSMRALKPTQTNELSSSFQESLERARGAAQQVALQGLQNASSQRVADDRWANELKENETMRNLAGQVEQIYFGDSRGADRAIAMAEQTLSNAYNEGVESANRLLDRYNADEFDMVDMALGAIGSEVKGITVTRDVKAASLRRVLGGKNVKAIKSLTSQLDFAHLDDALAQEAGDALKNNPARPFWIGSSIANKIKINDMPWSGQEFITQTTIKALSEDKLSTEGLVMQDAIYLNTLADMIENSNFRGQISQQHLQILRDRINEVRTTPQYSGRIGENISAIKRMEAALSYLPPTET